LINTNLAVSNMEKENKLCLQKMQLLNEEKKKTVTEEQLKYNEISQKCENFIKDFKSKVEGSIPDKTVLISENEKLKAQLEEAIKNANELKETLENQMKDKELKTQKIEDELRNDIKTRMEELVKFILILDLHKSKDFDRKYGAKEPKYVVCSKVRGSK
jgi:hypothetical protein